MEVQGTIIAVMPPRTGTSSAGKEWMTQKYVIQTHEQYPKKIAFELFGKEKIEQAGIAAGQELRVYFDIDAREFKGDWYNSIRAWKVSVANVGFSAPAPHVAPASSASPVDDFAAPTAAADPSEGDLPF